MADYSDAATKVANEIVSDLQTFLTKVDGSYPGRHMDLQPIITWKSSKTPVAREFRLPIPVEHSGSVVDYSFETLNNDIQFAVLFTTDEETKRVAAEETGEEEEDEEGSEKVVAGLKRFASHLGPVTGTFHLADPGRLILVWDNAHSWFKNKMLSYSVTLHVPSLLATERAKCSRATNALRACVKERDEAVERQEEAEAEVKETDSTVERLQEELKLLQATLDAETQRSDLLWREITEMERRTILETLKMSSLTFRLMPTTVLACTLSFGSEADQWWRVCKDWKEALQSIIEDDSANAAVTAEGKEPEV